MRIILHFQELNKKDNPRKETFYLKLDRLTDPDDPIIDDLGEVQAAMMSARLHRPMFFIGVEFPDEEGHTVGGDHARQVPSWKELVHSVS